MTGDFDKKVFNHTSGAENQLELVKNVLKVHTIYCTELCLYTFLEAVESILHHEVLNGIGGELNLINKKNMHVFIGAFGEIFSIILQSIPFERLTLKYKN